MVPQGVPAMVPEAEEIKGGDEPQYMSVLLNQVKGPQEVFKISENAKTPNWLTKKHYTKLNTQLEYEVRSMNTFELQSLQQKYKMFTQQKGQ